VSDIAVINRGLEDLKITFAAMQAFTFSRTNVTEDQLWVVQHPAVYTQGLNGKPEHILQTTDIPVVQVDRGGQVTYHGPGQVVIYLLLNIKRRHLGVRQLVSLIEVAVIKLLRAYGITANARKDAPGVYVAAKKIAALGLRIKKGCCYHGVSLNVAMDLLPFSNINPCGHAGLEVTQMSELGIFEKPDKIAAQLIENIQQELKIKSSCQSNPV